MGLADKFSLHIPFPSWAKDKTDPSNDYENWKELQRWANRLPLGGDTSVILPIGAGIAPDFTGTGNRAAGISKVVSSGTQTSNTPKVTHIRLTFADSADEHWMWAFTIPQAYVSGGLVRLTWGAATATSGDVVWKAGLFVSDSNDTDSGVFLAADTVTSTAPGTAGQLTESTIDLTTTGLSAGDWVVLFIGRDTDDAADTLSGDAFLVGASLEYN